MALRKIEPWKRHRFERPWLDWRKIRIGTDAQTLEIRAAEFTISDVGDAPMLPELLNQIRSDREIVRVTADGASDICTCHDAIAARGSAAIIPPRRNANHGSQTPQGRTIWRQWSGCGCAASGQLMHRVKLLGQRLMARNFDRQRVEFQVRIALNGFNALGIPTPEVVGRICSGKGKPRRHPTLATKPFRGTKG